VIEGNQRIETDAIRRVIKTKAGDVLVAKNTAEDLKAVFGMGYFDDVQIQSEREADGIKLLFKVVEKPTVRSIQVTGNVVFDEDEVKKSLTLKKDPFLTFTQSAMTCAGSRKCTKRKLPQRQVEYKLTPQKNNQVDVEYHIDEGSKILIKKILFTGNTAFSDRQLKGELTTPKKHPILVHLGGRPQPGHPEPGFRQADGLLSQQRLHPRARRGTPSGVRGGRHRRYLQDQRGAAFQGGQGGPQRRSYPAQGRG